MGLGEWLLINFVELYLISPLILYSTLSGHQEIEMVHILSRPSEQICVKGIRIGVYKIKSPSLLPGI